jgi:hypothetical protein
VCLLPPRCFLRALSRGGFAPPLVANFAADPHRATGRTDVRLPQQRQRGRAEQRRGEDSRAGTREEKKATFPVSSSPVCSCSQTHHALGHPRDCRRSRELTAHRTRQSQKPSTCAATLSHEAHILRWRVRTVGGDGGARRTSEQGAGPAQPASTEPLKEHEGILASVLLTIES